MSDAKPLTPEEERAARSVLNPLDDPHDWEARLFATLDEASQQREAAERQRDAHAAQLQTLHRAGCACLTEYDACDCGLREPDHPGHHDDGVLAWGGDEYAPPPDWRGALEDVADDCVGLGNDAVNNPERKTPRSVLGTEMYKLAERIRALLAPGRKEG